MRRTYPTETNKAYFVMAIGCLVSTVSDLISIYSIACSDSLPIWFNYIINLTYLVSYNSVAIIYFQYVDTLIKPKKTLKRVILTYVISSDLFILLTSPLLHLGIYFDDNNVYRHGSLFVLLYVNAIVILVYVLYLFLRNRKKLNNYQTFTIIIFNVATIGAVLFQMVYPRQAIGNLVCVLLLMLFYISLQAPEYYIDINNGCYNQNAFYETIGRYMSKGNPFTLVTFTLDGFKYINQVLGVMAGNDIINSIVGFLHSTFGKKNVYRLNGCRFVIINENGTGSEEVITSALFEYFKIPRAICQMDVLLTPYVCVVHHPDFAKTIEDINNAIDYSLNMGASSHAGKVVVASKESLYESRRKSNIIHIMKHAILYKEFEVYYQPIYHTETGKFSSAEALVRLRDEKLSFIPPDEFIPMAEQNGMIIEIGEIVFRKVCEFISKNDIKALGIDYIEVNLSFVQCMQEHLSRQLISIMEEYDVLPSQINFEITETAGFVKLNALRRNMDKLIEKGSTFSMDDYGTGFSTANYLVSLPLKLVKIDKSILWPAMKDKEAYVILRHTVNMLKDLHKVIVVEGVEDKKMADVLTEMNCDCLQGYLYSKPVPEDEYIKFLKEHMST